MLFNYVVKNISISQDTEMVMFLFKKSLLLEFRSLTGLKYRFLHISNTHHIYSILGPVFSTRNDFEASPSLFFVGLISTNITNRFLNILVYCCSEDSRFILRF